MRLYVRFLLALSLLAAGCRPPDDHQPGGRAMTDQMDRTVVLPDTVRRAVALAPSLTELLYAAGGGHRVAGASTADTYPPAVDSLPRFDALAPDFEAITALRPDLVLATDVNPPRVAETLGALGIPTYYFVFTSVDDVIAGIRELGAVLGTEAAAGPAADSLEAAYDRLNQWSTTVADRPDVLFLIGDQTLFAFGADSYMHAVIEAAGGRSLTADIETAAPILSDEFVLQTRPDVIVGTFGADYDPAELLAKHPSWSDVPAIRDGRVYSLDGDLLLRPGPRLVAGAYQMARVLHPNAALPEPPYPLP